MVGQTSWSWNQSNWDMNWEQSMLHHTGDNQHTQTIHINKVIGENEKCVFSFMGRKPQELFGWPNKFMIISVLQQDCDVTETRVLF